MGKPAIFTLLLLFACFSNIFAQQKLQGIVVEKNTGSPVAFATIQVKNAKSTLTNENGEFELSVNTLPTFLSISHLNYKSVSVEVSTAQSIKITVEPQALMLKDVIVGNPAIAIMQDARDKAAKIFDQSFYGKAFLRQIAYEGGRPTYMNEIFFDAEWKPFTMVSWNPTQARHLKGKSIIAYSNLSYLTFILSGYLGNNQAIKPLTKKVDSLYNLKLTGTYFANGQEIAKISCIPKFKIKGLTFEGDYYVNTVTNDVIKIEGHIKGIKISGGGPLGFKNKSAVFTAQFKLDKNGNNVLDYIILNTSNILKIVGIGAKTTDLYSTLYMIDDLPVNKTALRSIKEEIEDSAIAKAAIYEEDFWKNNQGIKRTAKEQSSIEILEKTPQVKK